MSEFGPTIEDVVRYALASSFARLMAHEQSVFDGRDPEGVHQARVATRRLRSDLRTFEPFLDSLWAAALRADLRWLTSDLGAVRDIEVMRAGLRDHAHTLSTSEEDAVMHVFRRLDADREDARRTVLAAMRSPQYTQLREELAQAAASPRFGSKEKKLASRELGPVVAGRWRKLRKAVDKLDATSSDDALHRVRIHAKRCRYAAEACAPAFGKPARRFAHAIAELQDILGEQHDAVVAGAWLAKTAPECTVEQAYALGRLAQIEHSVARARREEFFAQWKHACRKSLREWM